MDSLRGLCLRFFKPFSDDKDISAFNIFYSLLCTEIDEGILFLCVCVRLRACM
jgi:hypothetical protein